MINNLKIFQPERFISALILSLCFFFKLNSPILADTVNYLPISIWGSTINSLPFLACTGGTGGTVSSIPWTGTCCVQGTGGAISSSGGYTYHYYYSSGTFSVPQTKSVQVIVVAGGAVTADNSTGGRGGQVVYNSAYSVPSGNTTVTVGGAGANSVFGTITAIAGAGAIGGAGGNGGSRRYGLPGANGTLFPINGQYYGGAGGGGACCNNGSNGGLPGGAGGAGGGGYGGSFDYWAERGKWFGNPGGPGGTNTGGGGGAGGTGSDYGYGGSGAAGSGIIIIAYPSCT